MNTDNSIIKDIFRDLTFSEEEVKIIESVFYIERHKKGVFLLKENEHVDKQYYISSGCLRSYYTDPQGKEYTVQFGVKDWWISDYTAYFSATKSILNIEVLRDASLYMLSNDNKEYLYRQIPKIETFFRRKLEKAFAAFQRRILSNLSETASVRYTNFINTYPNIERSVKNYHIASYLGITTESLSRIRKELANS